MPAFLQFAKAVVRNPPASPPGRIRLRPTGKAAHADQRPLLDLGGIDLIDAQERDAVYHGIRYPIARGVRPKAIPLSQVAHRANRHPTQVFVALYIAYIKLGA